MPSLSIFKGERRPQLLVAGFIVLIAVLWTLIEALPLMMTHAYSLYQIVWMRYAVHLLVMAGVLGPRRFFGHLHTDVLKLQVGRGLLMLIMPVSFILAIGHMAIHNVLAIFWLCPLLILGFASPIGRERFGWPVWLGAIVSVIGAELILRPDAGILQSGALLALVMGASFSLYVVLTRRLHTEPLATNLIFTALCVFVPLSFVMPAVWKTPALQDVLVMATISLGGLGLLWALDRACELTSANSLAAFIPIQVVCGVLLTLLVRHSGTGKALLIGCALILGVAIFGLGISLVTQSHRPIEPATSQHG